MLVLRATAPHFLSFDSHFFCGNADYARVLGLIGDARQVGRFLVRDFVWGPPLEGVQNFEKAFGACFSLFQGF